MTHTQQTSQLYIGESTHKGRGVYTKKDILKGDIFEIAPLLILSPEDTVRIGKTHLSNYVYEYQDGCDAIALGYGSLYNHSYTPNACYEFDMTLMQSEFVAMVDINAGEEITINYNGDPMDQTELWFSVKT